MTNERLTDAQEAFDDALASALTAFDDAASAGADVIEAGGNRHTTLKQLLKLHDILAREAEKLRALLCKHEGTEPDPGPQAA